MTDQTHTLEPAAETQAQQSGGLNAVSIIIIVVVVALIALVGAQLANQTTPFTLAVGNPAPTFSLTTFDGQAMDNETLAGNVVVMNFWASWCVPCHDEAPMLESTWTEYADQNFIMLGVTHADVERDSREFIDQYAITYPNAPDPGAHIYDRYGLTGVPETFIIAPDGTVAYILRGPLTEATMPEFVAVVEQLLEGEA